MTKRSLYARNPAGLQRLAAFVVAATVSATVGAAERPPCAACLALIITPGQALVLPDELNGMTVLVRVGPDDERAGLAALEATHDRKGRGGLFVTGLPQRPLDAAVLALAQVVLIDPGVAPAAGIDDLAFQLKKQLTATRAAAPSAQLGIAAPADLIAALLSRGLAPYVDVLAWRGEPARDRPHPMQTWRLPPSHAEVMRDASAALRTTAGADADAWLWRAPEAIDELAGILGDLARAAPLLPRDLAPGSHVRVTCGGIAAETYLNPRTLDTIAVARGCAPEAPLEIEPAEPGIERVDLSSGDAIVRVPAAAAPDRFAEGVQVVGSQRLTVEEIVARHQAVAARQAAAIRTLISRGTLTISFEAPGFPAPVTIASDTTIYKGENVVDMEQRRIRVNGIEFNARGVPRLPILEPERVSAPPLAITLGPVYRYRLAGEDTVNGLPAYVVEFEPGEGSASLHRGRAWIARDGFALLRVSAAQTALRGAIVSSEQIDEYRRDAGGRWLLARSDVRQIYEGAARRTPIHRVLAVDSHEVNPPDFDRRRAAAHASDAVMLRDTPQGYRYLQRPPAREAHPGEGGSQAVERVVTRGATRVRTLAGGVIIDPNISRPLPFAGLSYVDFDLLGTGAQLNAFFGGSYGQLAFSAPSVRGSRWQLSARAFGIASSYHDRSFLDGRERYDENIRQRPAHASVSVLRPLSPRLSARIGYELDYTHFAAAESTAPVFVVPESQVVHGLRLAIEGQRGGWNGAAWWNPARRAGWRRWGNGGSEYEGGHRDFQRYGVSLVRSMILSPALSARVEGAMMAGTDLDRFSRYSFGTFDNRLRGYPSALIRYDRGAVARGALAWSPGRFVRVDGFLDSAFVRDLGYGRRGRNYTGIGAAAEVPAPFGTLLAIEWGYGFRGISADGTAGTHVLRISGYKIF